MSSPHPPPDDDKLDPRAVALIRRMAAQRLEIVPRRRAPASWREVLRLYEWASERPHVVIRGAVTGRFDVIPIDWQRPETVERWAAACAREGDPR